MKFNTATTIVLVLLSALELCSAVKYKEDGSKVADLDKVALDLMDTDTSKRDQYIFTSNELNYILNAKYDIGVKDRLTAVKKGLVEAAEKDTYMKVNYAFNLVPTYETFLSIYNNPEAVRVLRLIMEHVKLVGADNFKLENMNEIVDNIAKAKNDLKAKQD